MVRAGLPWGPVVIGLAIASANVLTLSLTGALAPAPPVSGVLLLLGATTLILTLILPRLLNGREPDIVDLARLNAVRLPVGLAFLGFAVIGEMPLVLGLVAGVGDSIVGILAIPAARVGGVRLTEWQVLGLADFVTVGVLAGLTNAGVITDDIGLERLATWPVAILLCLAVPLLLAAHVRALRRGSVRAHGSTSSTFSPAS